MHQITKNKDVTKYQAKAGFKVKDVDTQTRRVKIMLSHFDNVDSDGDVIRKGAFAKSIMERGPESTSNRKIQFLRHHDWQHQIGKFISLEETHDGLVAVGELSTSTPGDNALKDYQGGVINEHSIGFNYVQDKMELVGSDENQFWDIKEVALWEGSAVTFGANSLTPVLDVSKGDHVDFLQKLNEKTSTLISAIKDGGTDERLYNLEMALKVCQQQFNDLLSTTQPAPATEPEKTEVESNAKDFYLNLYTK